METDAPTCWVCLDDMSDQDPSTWFRPCACPRVVHRVCLARWCLQQAGKSEEKKCRFCSETLPDWQANLTPPGLSPAEPVMSVHFAGKAYLVRVSPGEDGRKQFLRDIRKMLNLRADQEFDVTFECRLPSVVAIGGGTRVDLKGLSAYDAAVFCAALTAADRQRSKTAEANAACSGSGADGQAAGEDVCSVLDSNRALGCPAGSPASSSNPSPSSSNRSSRSGNEVDVPAAPFGAASSSERPRSSDPGSSFAGAGYDLASSRHGGALQPSSSRRATQSHVPSTLDLASADETRVAQRPRRSSSGEASRGQRASSLSGSAALPGGRTVARRASEHGEGSYAAQHAQQQQHRPASASGVSSKSWKRWLGGAFCLASGSAQ